MTKAVEADRQELPPRLAFGRADWTRVTGLPMTTLNHLVAAGQIRSSKIGRRRFFLYKDVEKLLTRLADRGEALQPRKLNEERARRRGGAR